MATTIKLDEKQFWKEFNGTPAGNAVKKIISALALDNTPVEYTFGTSGISSVAFKDARRISIKQDTVWVPMHLMRDLAKYKMISSLEYDTKKRWVIINLAGMV